MGYYIPAFAAFAFVIGILLVGLSGNKGMRLKTLVFSIGALLIIAGTVVELSALASARAGSSAGVQG